MAGLHGAYFFLCLLVPTSSSPVVPHAPLWYRGFDGGGVRPGLFLSFIFCRMAYFSVVASQPSIRDENVAEGHVEAISASWGEAGEHYLTFFQHLSAPPT